MKFLLTIIPLKSYNGRITWLAALAVLLPSVKWSISPWIDLDHSSQAGLQLLNILVTFTLSPSTLNYDTHHDRKSE